MPHIVNYAPSFGSMHDYFFNLFTVKRPGYRFTKTERILQDTIESCYGLIYLLHNWTLFYVKVAAIYTARSIVGEKNSPAVGLVEG